jgi:hypothetical protein
MSTMSKHASHADYILALDMQQHPSNKKAVRCPKNESHGVMLANAEGTHFLCKCGATALAQIIED